MRISGSLHSDSYSKWNIDRKTLVSIYLPYDSLPMLQLHAELKATYVGAGQSLYEPSSTVLQSLIIKETSRGNFAFSSSCQSLSNTPYTNNNFSERVYQVYATTSSRTYWWYLKKKGGHEHQKVIDCVAICREKSSFWQQFKEFHLASDGGRFDFDGVIKKGELTLTGFDAGHATDAVTQTLFSRRTTIFVGDALS